MNNVDKEKLNNRLVESVGIKKIHYEEWDTEHQIPMFIPSGKPWRTHQIDAMPVPKLYLSMDACLTWLWPKAPAPIEIGNIKMDDGTKGWCCKIGNSGWVKAESMSLAFCLAADKYFIEVNK